MRLLLDTGILLRFGHPTHPQAPTVTAAVRRLRQDGHTFVAGVQNIAEFWNVSTRPADARGGFGLSLDDAEQRLLMIEDLVEIVTESPASYEEWRRLVVLHGVSGVQVHDARLVDVMVVEQVPGLFTLNPRDFVRYPWLTVLTPDHVLAAGGTPPGQFVK